MFEIIIGNLIKIGYAMAIFLCVRLSGERRVFPVVQHQDQL